jgi:hypothetical protein
MATTAAAEAIPIDLVMDRARLSVASRRIRE